MANFTVLRIYALFFLSLFSLSAIGPFIRPFHSNLLLWQQRQKEAKTYLASEVCGSLKAKLPTTSRCEELELLLKRSAFFEAFWDTIEDAGQKWANGIRSTMGIV